MQFFNTKAMNLALLKFEEAMPLKKRVSQVGKWYFTIFLKHSQLLTTASNMIPLPRDLPLIVQVVFEIRSWASSLICVPVARNSMKIS